MAGRSVARWLLGLLCGAHFNKAKAARTAGFTIHDDVSGDDITAAAEMCAQGIASME
jgi:acid phosphatase class B